MNPNPTPPPFVLHQVADHQHRMVAATIAHPAGWQAQSQVQWNFQHYAQPVVAFARVAEPGSGASVEFFPLAAFCWIEPFYGFQQPGQDAGGGKVLLQPMPSVDALLQWVIPRYRDSRTLRFVGARGVPAQMLEARGSQPGFANRMTEGVSVGVEGRDAQGPFEEEFYALRVSYPPNPSQGGYGTLMQYNWGFERLFSFRAPKGQLDGMQEIGWAIAQSWRANPQWEQVLNQIVQQLGQQFNQHIQDGYAQIEAANRLSQQISANNAQWLRHQQERRDQQYQSEQWRRQEPQGTQGAYTQTDAFGDMMLGRETYHDPYYEYGSQHTGYHQYVWTDSQGNYQYSDDANFDPNPGSSQTWVPMQKREVNG